MTQKTPSANSASAKDDERKARKDYLSDLLDEALEDSFPASDPPSVVRPGYEIPIARRNDKAR